MLTWNTFSQGILPVLAASTAAHSPSTLRWSAALALVLLSLRHDYPPSDDTLSSYDFSLEFLPIVNFGESFGFDGCFYFDDFGEGGGVFSASNSLSYGKYDNISCLMSIKSHVRL